MNWVLKQQICRALIGILLFAQMAVAAYACQGMSFPKAMTLQHQATSQMAAAAASDEAMAGCPDCGRMDDVTPNLCAEHCRSDSQNSDHTPAPTVPAVLLLGFYTVPLLPVLSGPTQLLSSPENLSPAISPPHAILHCCFRI